MTYRIKQADTDDQFICDTLTELDQHCFPGESGGALPDFTNGHWWLTHHRDGEAAGYCGIIQSTWHETACYLKRVGVHGTHTGNGLQKRMTAVAMRKAKLLGFLFCVTDCTTNNPASANSLVAAGFKIFYPPTPWALEYSIYWKKRLFTI